MSTIIKFKWEPIDVSESSDKSLFISGRVKTIGGWIVRTQYLDIKLGTSESMVFIPDPNHEWKIEE